MKKILPWIFFFILGLLLPWGIYSESKGSGFRATLEFLEAPLPTPNVESLRPQDAPPVSANVSLHPTILPPVVIPSRAVIASPSVPIQPQIVTPNKTSSPNAELKSVTNTPELPLIKPPKPIIAPLVFNYSYPENESFIYPIYQAGKYPDLDIRGYYEGKISGRNYNPKTPSDSRWITIQQDPIYNKLPKNVMVGDPRLEIRYKFNIDGKLNKDLTVHYDIEQEPEFPGKYDVTVQYKNTNLTFFEFDTQYNNGEYTNVRRALNGFQATHVTDEWEATFSMGKERSEPKKYENFGTGSKIINLGARYILEDSVHVWVNQQPKSEHADYEVNYFDGVVTFKDTKSITDYIVITYEFTNPIEAFIPSLTRKSFMGAQYLWRSKATVQETTISREFEEIIKPSGTTPNAEYTLKVFPLVLASDTVRLNGRVLNKNKDYFVKNGKKIVIHDIPISKDDQLSIQYKAYMTEEVSDNLIGKEVPGPYQLSHKNILDETLVVLVGGVPMKSGPDYSLEAETSKLYFQYPIHYPTLIEAQYTAIKTQVLVSTGNNVSPLKVGVTYLNEYINAQAEKMVLAVPTESYTITSNVITTHYNPIEPSQSISVVVDGAVIPSASSSTTPYYTVNAYTGQITIYNKSIVSSTATVQYSYKKSFKTTFVFQGKQGSTRGNVYTNGVEFTLRDTPVKYQGLNKDIGYIRILQGSEEFYLTEGIEYTVNYGQDGQAIQIQFHDNGEAGYGLSQIYLNKPTSASLTYPDASSRITMVYQYTPPSSPDQGNLNQTQVGFTMGKQLSDNWSVDSELSLTNLSQSKAKSSGENTFSGTGVSNYSYALSHSNLVENSEAVFLDKKRVNKDKDYIINYVAGTIKFLNLVPSALDTILVTYDYYDTNGTISGTNAQPWKPATRIATQFQNQDITLKGDYKYIDKDFAPIGDIHDQKGSSILGGSMDWRVDNLNTLFFDYHKYDRKVGINDQSQDVLFHTDDARATAKLNLYGVVDTVQSARYLLEIQDPTSVTATQNQHATDQITIDYTGDASFGPDSFRNTFSRGYSKQITDYLDNQNRTIATTEKFRASNQTTLKNLWIFGTSSLMPAFEFSESKTNSNFTSTQNILIPQTGYSNRTIYGLASTQAPLPYLNTRLELNRDEVRAKTSTQVTENLNILSNNNYSLSFTPFSWFNAGVNINHHESESPLVNQKGEISDSRGYQISRLTPLGILTSLGMDGTSFWLYPIRSSNLSYSRNETDRQENNNRRQYGNNRDYYSLNGIDLVDGISLKSISYEAQFSHNLNTEGSFTASQNSSFANYSKGEGSFTIAPKVDILKLFSYSYGFEDRVNHSVNEDQAFSATSNKITGDSPYFRRNQQLSFNPGDIVVGIPYLFSLNLGRFSSSVQENFELKTNSTLTEKYPTSNVDQALTSSLVQDNSRIRTYTFTSALSPLNILTFSGSYIKNKEDLSRNLNPSNVGTTFKDQNTFSLSSSYSPLSFLMLQGSYQAAETSQYRSPTINSSLGDIQTGLDDNNSLTATDFLYNRDETYMAGMVITPHPLFSINGSGTFKRLETHTDAINSYTASSFKQKIGSAGLTLRPPITGLSMGYTYSLIYTDSSGGSTSKGYSGNTVVTYTPSQTPGFKVSFSYTRNDTWGFDLNTLDRTLTEQGTGNDTGYQVVERQDTVEMGAMTVEINIPITTSPFLDSVIITGEGYIKKVTDYLDDTRPANNQHTYDVSGMIIKGTLNF